MSYSPRATLFFGWALTRAEVEDIELELDPADFRGVFDEQYGAFSLEKFGSEDREPYLYVAQSGNSVDRDTSPIATPTTPDASALLGASYPCFRKIIDSRPGQWFLSAEYL